jgi:hypothetical protein
VRMRTRVELFPLHVVGCDAGVPPIVEGGHLLVVCHFGGVASRLHEGSQERNGTTNSALFSARKEYMGGARARHHGSRARWREVLQGQAHNFEHGDG